MKILNSFIDCYGSETKYLQSEGDALTQEETEDYIKQYLREYDF